jgi:PAS domain S-box-containing protein
MGASGLSAAGMPDPEQYVESERALHRNQKTLLAILECASQAILSVDREGRIVLANAKTEEIFGYTRDELLGQPVEMLLPDAARGVHMQHRTDFIESPRVRPMGLGMDLAGRRKDGKEFPVEISLSYVEIDQKLFVIAFITDITQRKTLEEQLLQSQKMEAVGRLAGGIAHDFNNMLTIISGYNRMMMDDFPPDGTLREYAEEVLKASDRAAALTRQLLAFSRRQIMRPQVLSVNALIQDIQKMLRPLISEDIELQLHLGATVGMVKADPSQLEQVLFNLAVNSRDAMPRGGRITIETEEVILDREYIQTHLGVAPGPYIMIAFTDTGDGMDAEIRKHIFEPFFTTKEPGKGTGLGLATVYGIVKQSGGDIWVYSEPGEGTTFKIYLPKVTDKSAAPPERRSRRRARGTETILVVEDEPGVSKLLVGALRKQGYTVLEANDTMEAVQISESHAGTIHLVLTDVVMPRMSGSDLAAELRLRRPDIKVVYMSGYTENAAVHRGILEANAHFIPKPFSVDELTAKLREALDL